MLNPHESVDNKPEVRFTDSDGHGAVHLAVIHGHLDILKILLETDKTLLCMETENEDASYIMHLAVVKSNLPIMRYLIEKPAFFRLFSEKVVGIQGFNKSVDARRGTQQQMASNPYD